jgi:hypothetical protein
MKNMIARPYIREKLSNGGQHLMKTMKQCDAP